MRDGGTIQGEAALGGARVVNFVRLADEAGGQPLHERLYRRIRSLIISGALAHGSKLAPSRVLAEQLGISRNSVLNAIDRLVADGWLEARRGSGVYVAYAGTRVAEPPQAEPPPRKTEVIPFKSGVPPLDLFPIETWNRLQTRLWRNMPQAGLLEGHSAGQPALRQAIAAHLAAARGFDCSPDRIVVTSSLATGLSLAVRALGLAGTTAWIEDPGYGGTKQALHNAGMQLMPVPVDAEGFDIGTALRMGSAARAALVMPVAQFPMGAMLSKRRREALLAWAGANNGWVLEDDSGWNDALTAPERPLAAGGAANVIYLSSFNYTLFPALRIAYMVLPPELVDRFIAVRRGLDAATNVPNQMILADFLDGGYFDEHLHRCRAALAERRSALLEILARRLGHVLVPRETQGSSHLVCDLLGIDEEGFGARAAALGIAVKQMRRLRLIAGGPPQVMLGYAYPLAAIRQAAEALAEAFA